MTGLQGYPHQLKQLSHKDRLEAVAALVIEATTGVTLRKWDPGGGSQQRADFEIVDSNEHRIGVVEVTTTTVQRRAQFNAQVAKKTWKFPELSWHWTINVLDESDPQVLHKSISSILAELEAQGRTFDTIPEHPALEPDQPGSLPTALREVGVIRACAVQKVEPSSEEGVVFVHSAARSGAFSLNAVTSAVETELWKPDNLAKTQVDGENQLFVWLDVTDAQVAVLSLLAPPFDQIVATMTPPKLPSQVSAVWAAIGSASLPVPASALLRSTRDHWEIIDPPSFGQHQF